MRRFWSPTTSGRPHASRAGIDLSTVLVVHAVGGPETGSRSRGSPIVWESRRRRRVGFSTVRSRPDSAKIARSDRRASRCAHSHRRRRRAAAPVARVSPGLSARTPRGLDARRGRRLRAPPHEVRGFGGRASPTPPSTRTREATHHEDHRTRRHRPHRTLLVQELLARGHALTLLVRDPAKAASVADRVTLVEGDGRDTARRWTGSSTAPMPSHPRSARSARDNTLLRDTARGLTAAMTDAGI